MSLLKCISLSNGALVAPPQESVVCLGNFDGVHLAHQALLKKALEIRQKYFPTAACAVLCFSSLSSDHLLASPPAHLSTLEQKRRLFAEMGMEYLFLAEFDQLRSLTPKDFILRILQEQCHCVAAVCGFNYRFGKNGSGNADTLRQLLGAPVTVLDEILADGSCVSSTKIRNLLALGKVDVAAKLLTRPYSFEAEVVHGKSLGRAIGVPTLNQFFPPKVLIPCHGVYITDCEVDGVVYRGVSNVGVHPTVDDAARVNCETHLLDVSQDLYGKLVKVSFLSYLRPECRFDSIEALQKQLQTDIEAARSYQKEAL